MWGAPIPPKNDGGAEPQIVDRLWFHNGADVLSSNVEATRLKTNEEPRGERTINERVRDIILEHIGSKVNPKPYYYGKLLEIARKLLRLLPGPIIANSKALKEKYDGAVSEGVFCNNAGDQLTDLLLKCDYESNSYIMVKAHSFVKLFTSKYSYDNDHVPNSALGYNNRKLHTAVSLKAPVKTPAENTVEQPPVEFKTRYTTPHIQTNAQKTAPKNTPQVRPFRHIPKYSQPPRVPAARRVEPRSAPNDTFRGEEVVFTENVDLLRSIRDGAFIEFIQVQERKKLAKHVIDSLICYLVD